MFVTIASAEQALKNSSAEENEAPANPMGTMMSQQLLLIPTVMLSLIVGLILTRVTRLKEPKVTKERARQLAKQVVLALVFLFIIALTAYAMSALVAGGEADFWSIVLFIWIVSFALMLLVGGLANIAFGLAVLAVVCIIAFDPVFGNKLLERAISRVCMGDVCRVRLESACPRAPISQK